MWECKIENWKEIDENKADFVLSQAKNFLENSVDVSDKLDTKSTLILGVIFTVMAALFVYLVKDNPNLPLKISSMSLLLIAGCSSIFFIRSLTPKKFFLVGQEPQNLLVDSTMNCDIRMIKIGEAIAIQERIDNNRDLNEKKAQDIILGLKIAFIAPIAGAIIFLLFS